MDVTVAPVSRLSGRISVPGDKSISHRAAIIGAISSGVTTVRNFLQAEDCLRTLACLRDLGVRIEDDQGELVIHGAAGRLSEPAHVLDAGNSGTTMRLLAGVLAAQLFTAELDGDESLRRRPMDRLADPLRRMGAHVGAREGRYPPLRIMGAELRGVTYEVPVASAQVKSAVLLAGILGGGETTVIEPTPTRDHTERMLAGFGVPVRRSGNRTTVTPAVPRGSRVIVPGDLSSAAFFLAAAAAIPGSELTVENVGVNPTRTGVLDVFRAMGAPAVVEGVRDQSWEPVGHVSIRGRRPHGMTIDGTLIPRLIDELPVLCILAAVAEGRTVIRDASELRVKESDRIGVLVTGLRALGARVQERLDGMEIEGGRLRGGTVDAAGDHRIAMAFAVAGLLAEEPVTVRGAESVAVSFPGFFETLGAVTGRKPVVSGAGSNG